MREPKTEQQRINELRAVRGCQAAMNARPPLTFRWPKRAKDFVPVLGTGGIGDTFVTMGVCEAVAHTSHRPVRLYTLHPDVAEWIKERWPNAWAPNVEVCREPFPGYDHHLRVNSLATFHFQRNFKGFNNSAMDDMHLSTKHHVPSEWWRFIEYHPYLDGELSREAVEIGLRRWTMPHWMLGLGQPREPYELSPTTTRYDWEPFVTVHDGYESNQPNVHRATKTWNLRHWATFVRDLKSRRSDLMVVQLGANNSRRIPGVDVDLVGRTDIREALDVLSRSSLHVDGDSGFVHAAAHLRVPTVAMFGPTPKEFFGYPGNENLSSGDCGNCYWTRDSWLVRCPIGNDGPVCMDRIAPGRVLASAERLLDRSPRPR